MTAVSPGSPRRGNCRRRGVTGTAMTGDSDQAALIDRSGLLLEARGLVKTLGGVRVVDGVDLSCAPGEVLGLLGPNGAGKTTTLRMCYGFLEPDAGSVHIAGHDLAQDPDTARRALGVCTQDDTFDADFTVRG